MTPDDLSTLKAKAEQAAPHGRAHATDNRDTCPQCAFQEVATASVVLGLIAALERLEQEQARLTSNLQTADAGHPATLANLARTQHRVTSAERDLALVRETLDPLRATTPEKCSVTDLARSVMETLRDADQRLARVEGERDALIAELTRERTEWVTRAQEWVAQAHAEGRAAERAVRDAMVRALPNPVAWKHLSSIYECAWCRETWGFMLSPAQREQNPPPHPINGCLWQQAHAVPEAPQ